MIACFYMPQIAIATERIRALSLWGRPVALIGENEALVCVSEEAAMAGVKPGQVVAGGQAAPSDAPGRPWKGIRMA